MAEDPRPRTLPLPLDAVADTARPPASTPSPPPDPGLWRSPPVGQNKPMNANEAVVPSADAEALAQAMREAIASRDRLRAMGESARARVRDCTWQAYGERAAALVRRLLG